MDSIPLTNGQKEGVSEVSNIPLSLSSEIPSLVQTTESKSLVEKADAVAKRMEEANKKAEQLIERQEALAARLRLEGRAEAGQKIKGAAEIEAEKLNADIANTLNKFKMRR
jgi:hypothetical protein